MGVNHLGHHLLTRILEENLIKAALEKVGQNYTATT